MVGLYRHKAIVGQARMPTPRDQYICLFGVSAFDQNVGGFWVSSKMEVKFEGRTYSFEVAVNYAIRVEITKTFCHLAEL
jgi:hypothetical protein